MKSRGRGDLRIMLGDAIVGGGGADVFVVAAPGSTVDTVVDFTNGDQLEISVAAFGGGLAAGDAAMVVNVADFASANTVGGTFIFDTAGPDSDTLYWDATGGSGADAIPILRLHDVASLASSDLLLL